jgi:hypothetical protein
MGNTFGDIILNAGVETSYTANKTAGVASSVATSEIKKASFFDTLAMATYDVTDEDYQFLKLQLEADPTATVWDITKAVNPTGYYLLDVAVCFEDHYSNLGPAGANADGYFDKTNTEVYVVWNDSLQLIGCLNNALEAQYNLEFSEILKGAVDSTVALSISKRDIQITNLMSYGYNTWLLKEITKSNVKVSSDGLWEVNEIDNAWKKIENYEFFLYTHDFGGREIVTHIKKGVIVPNGNIPFGSSGSNIPFTIRSLGTVEARKSVSYWDRVKIAVSASITA